MRHVLRIAVVVACAVELSACSYGGIATTADGKTLFVAVNGTRRRIYKCDVSPTTDDLFCRELRQIP